MFAFVAGLISPLSAQNSIPAAPRLAVLDVQAVLTTSAAGKAAFEKLKKMQDDRIAEAKRMDDRLRQLEGTAPGSTAASQKEIADQRVAIQRFAQEADRELAEARDRELAALESRIKPIVDAVAAEMGLDAILNKYESGLIFASPRIEITETIIQRFNRTIP
jgi:outer membrane protein